MDRAKGSAIRPLIEELKYEGKPGQGVPCVNVSGMVHFPGEYPFTPNMNVSDLIVAGGGMTGSAYTLSSELSRQSVDLNTSNPTATIAHFTLESLLLPKLWTWFLCPKDILSIKPIPSWSENNSIEILGEVRFPGHLHFPEKRIPQKRLLQGRRFYPVCFPERGCVYTKESNGAGG